MSDLSRHRPYLIAGGALVVVAVALVLALVPPGTWVAVDQRRSATRTSPDGVAAWARSLEALGVPVARRFRSLTDETPRGGGLVLLEPVQPPTAAEVHAALEWARGGGIVVYSPALDGLLMDSVGLTGDFRSSGSLAPVRDSLPAHRWSGGGLSGPGNSVWVLEADSARAESWEPLSFILGAEDVNLAWLPEGEGGLFVVADARALTNRFLGESAQAVVLTRALADRLGPADTVFFSEFHQALGGGRGAFRETFHLARDTPLGRVVLHLAVVGLALLLVAGRRFGEPLPGPPGERRSTLEHVEALAGIYEAGSSKGAVARHLFRGAARRMGALHPTTADPEAEILDSWRARPELAGPAQAALDALHADPPDLTTLERALDTISARHSASTGPR